LSTPDREAVATLLATAFPAPVVVEGAVPLTGGASADTWSLDVVDAAGVAHGLILRRNAGRGGPGLGLDARVEPLVQRAAGHAAVPVAEVVAIFDDAVLGTGYVMRRLAGETIPRKLLREPAYAAALSRLAGDSAAALAAIHAVPLDQLPAMPELPAAEQLALLESLHRSVGQPVPTFELGLRWLHDNLPPPGPLCLVHGDFRMGNFLLDEHGLVAVLDWELAHLGDPMEDIAWLCTRAWRFGGPGEVGGFASRDDFSVAYGDVDPGRVRFWDVLAALKWGVICQLQSFPHLRGEVRSVERAAIGRRVTEAELDLLLVLEERHA
jgi:aminoglycoside phosphotransferase (APT) family kinase protein